MTLRADARLRESGFSLEGVRSYLIQRALEKLEASFSETPRTFVLTLPDGRGMTFGSDTPAFRVTFKSLAALSALAFLACVAGFTGATASAAYVTGLLLLLMVCAMVFYRIIASLLRPHAPE